jgi:hypothetical protein
LFQLRPEFALSLKMRSNTCAKLSVMGTHFGRLNMANGKVPFDAKDRGGQASGGDGPTARVRPVLVPVPWDPAAGVSEVWTETAKFRPLALAVAEADKMYRDKTGNLGALGTSFGATVGSGLQVMPRHFPDK